MDIIGTIIVEVLALFIVGIPATYFIWKLGKKKLSFGDFLTKYGYGIAWISLLIIVIIVAYARTTMR